MMFNKWFRPPALDPLSVSMSGVKLGDRVLVIGCSDPHADCGARSQSRPVRAYLRGRRVARRRDRSWPRRTQGRRARRDIIGGAVRAAVRARLVRSRRAPERPGRQASGSLGRWPPRRRRVCCVPAGAAWSSTLWRGAGWRRSLAGRRHLPADVGEAIEILKGQGFVAVRMLAERDGLRFIEAVKKNS